MLEIGNERLICQAWGVAASVGSAGGANVQLVLATCILHIYLGSRTLSCIISFFIGSFCICFKPSLTSQISVGKAANSFIFFQISQIPNFSCRPSRFSPAKMSISPTDCYKPTLSFLLFTPTGAHPKEMPRQLQI